MSPSKKCCTVYTLGLRGGFCMSAARLLKGNGRFTPCTCSRLSSSSVKCASAYSAPTAPAAGDPASGPFGYGRCSLNTCSWIPFMLFLSFSLLGHLRLSAASAQAQSQLSEGSIDPFQAGREMPLGKALHLIRPGQATMLRS